MTTSSIPRTAAVESIRSAVYETSSYTYTSSGGQVVYATTILTTYVLVPAATTTGARTLNSSGDASGGNTFFSKTGAVVGVFLAVGLIVAIIAVGLGFFYLRRKRRRRLDEDLRVAAGGAGDGGAGIARFTDDDSQDGHGNPYDPTSASDGWMSSFGPPATLSSYGAVGMTGAAAGYGLARTPYDQAHDDTPYRRPLSYGASAADSDHARQRRYSAELGHHSPSPSDGSLHGKASAYGGFSTLGHSRGFSGEGTEEDSLPEWARGFFDQVNGGSTERSSPEQSGGGVERLEALEEAGVNPFVVSKPDDRIEPLLYKDDDNVSQESLADGHDYSRKRVLRVANPSDE
ncbi:BQ2448_4609 [Microbotryum intermedium]|uniref:BQ2448_4609 protein n=1 Tax=Microbotryum intermedium TaxID=269621 RepID=A0A238FFD9_9BASI|nr:BQ2448_4609 [Microbotryum intermedium]